MAAVNSSDASLHQQVMGAQMLQAQTANGVIPDGQSGATQPAPSQDPPPEDSAIPMTSGSAAYVTADATVQGAAGDVLPSAQTSAPADIGAPTSAPAVVDAVPALGQAGQQQPTTIQEVDGMPLSGMSSGGAEQGIGQQGFHTPRSTASQNNWLQGLEVPRWVSRLGNYLSTGYPELAPSPLVAGRNSPPRGGQPFMLRSPVRQAIEAEVQRQLGGIMGRLRLAEVILLWGLWDLVDYGVNPNQVILQEPSKVPVYLQAYLQEPTEVMRYQEARMDSGTTEVFARTKAEEYITGPGHDENHNNLSLSDHAEAALAFQDWVEMSSTTMGDISERSGAWWASVVKTVESTYAEWLSATPLERLAVAPPSNHGLTEGIWSRLNARAASMLLAAMDDEVKNEMVALRVTQDSVRMLFRLYVRFQPGGAAERSDVLKRLQNPGEFVGSDDLEHVLKALRAWPRWLARCRAVRMEPPDPTVLAKGLLLMTDRYVSQSADAAFRTAMLRTSLRLDAQPSLDQVQAYQKHLQAELDVISASTRPTTTSAPRVRAIDTSGSPTKAKDKDRGAGVRLIGSETAKSGVHDGPFVTSRSRYASLVGFVLLGWNAMGVSDGGSSPEKTSGSNMKKLRISNIHVCTTGRGSAALLDSGATHCLRSAHSDQEWLEAEEIMVELAGGSSLVMRMGASGSLLMPPTSTPTSSCSATNGSQTIVPVGQLVKVLGYTLVWGPGKCCLLDPDGEKITLSTSTGCPQLCEAEALSMIARIEDRRRETLENQVADTQDRLSLAALAMERGWQDHLQEYVETGSTTAGGRALRDATFLRGLPAECLEGLVQPDINPGSWEIMKSINYLTRPQRRHLWKSRKWVIHMYAGNPGHWQVFRLDAGETAVIELDIDRCQAHSVLNNATWRLLLYGALTGKIDAIVGGPPGRGGLRGSDKDVRNMKLIARMLWLYAVAKASRSQRSMAHNKDRPVGFMMEHPARESLTTTTGVDRSMWGTNLWSAFKEEMGMEEITFDQAATGSTTTCPTTLGTNIYYLQGLKDLEAEQSHDAASTTGAVGAEWSPGLVDAIAMALRLWDRGPCEIPSIKAMTPEQWKSHVAGGHMDYRRDCLTCVMGRGTGKRHARVRHPDSFCLTIDVSGPVKPGVDCTSKGTMGKGLKYMVIAKYTLPREFVKGYTGKEPPQDDGLVVGMACEAPDGEGEEEHDSSAHDKELTKPSLPQPHEGGEEEQHRSSAHDQELTKPSLPQPHEGGDPFSLCEDELDGQDRGIVVDDEPGGSKSMSDEKHAGSSSGQQKHFEDYEDSLYEPSEVDEGMMQQAEEEADTTKVFQDCGEPLTTSLLFARGVKDNLSSTIKAVIQDIILYLEAHGLPVYRLHADKGETFNHSVRSWLRDRGVRATWSEPGVPKGNGSAEATVRWVKDRARTLLLGARMPTRLWALAAEAATAMQRAKVLSWRSRMMAPFGAVVHVKQKAFDSSGPRKRDRAFETKWLKGYYVGLSSILDGGHVVYVPQETEDDREKFLHTFHVRPRLLDPGVPQDELHVDDPPRPRRRVVEKKSPDRVEMRTMGLSEAEVREYVLQRSACLLEMWNLEQAERFIIELLEADFFGERKFGIFRHGGSVGWLNGSEEFPDLARVLARIVHEAEPEATFTSIWVTRDSMKGYHKDINNDADTVNYALPLQVPDKGGQLWLELGQGDTLRGEVGERADAKGRVHYGQILPLVKGQCTAFCPRRGHEVLPWVGTRSMILAYTPQCMGKLDYDIVKKLEALEFPTPISQLPEYFSPDPPGIHQVTPSAVEKSDVRIQEESVNAVTGMYGDDEWEMFLEVPDGVVKVGDHEEHRPPESIARAAKVEVSYTPNIERVLAELRGPLKVTHTVDPREVQENLELWRGAIEKEVKNVEVAILRLLPGTPERAMWIKRPKAQRLPAKLVFTVKPGDSPNEADPTTWFKRKARLVVCGNFARPDEADLYSETPPTEVLRAGLTLSRRRKWYIAILDVVAAFLRAPIGDNASDPTVLVTPPRLLQSLGLIVECELWALIRALYGLRQAPALWSSYRDKTLDALRFPGNLSLRRGRTVTAWWVLQDESGAVSAVIIIYVDDIMLIGPEATVRTLSDAIQALWKTSPLTFLTPSSPIRFLGMELELSEDLSTVYVNQTAYIEEILRAYQVPSDQKDKIPISKELASFEVGPDDIPPTVEDVAAAQKLTGELMWIAQKSRPDISFTCSMLASLSTKAPSRCLAVGEKALRYLQGTKTWRMKFTCDNSELVLYPDAAFAPSSGRSHSGWVIMWSGSAVAWRSARQSTIALSTAESELLAILEGSVGMMGVEALLYDVKEGPLTKTIASDSTSALSISSGTGSWRTRHLRLKAGWIQEMLQTGVLNVRHQPGITQPADMLTKALASQRLKALMSLWGMEEKEVKIKRVNHGLPGRPSTKIVMALVCCLMMLTVEASEVAPRPIQVERQSVNYEDCGSYGPATKHLNVFLKNVNSSPAYEIKGTEAYIFTTEYTTKTSHRGGPR
ncbi:unnamed protein product [Symbiodinium sp. CCMP2592]|nr:unnamed protein product [Symbiodinium sp. CCMP2592]